MKITLTLGDPEVLHAALLKTGLLLENEEVILCLGAIPCDDDGTMWFGNGNPDHRLCAIERNPLHTHRVALPSRLELGPIETELRPKRNGDTIPHPTIPGGFVSLPGMIASISEDGESIVLTPPSGVHYLPHCPEVGKVIG